VSGAVTAVQFCHIFQLSWEVGGFEDSEHLATLGSSALHHVTQLELAKSQTTLGVPPQHTHPVIQHYSDWFSPTFHKKWT
jgi:hypothetical protein